MRVALLVLFCLVVARGLGIKRRDGTERSIAAKSLAQLLGLWPAVALAFGMAFGAHGASGDVLVSLAFAAM